MCLCYLLHQESLSCGVALVAGGGEASGGNGEDGGDEQNLSRVIFKEKYVCLQNEEFLHKSRIYIVNLHYDLSDFQCD